MDTETLEASVAQHEKELELLLSAVDFFESHLLGFDDEDERNFEEHERVLRDDLQQSGSDTKH